MNILEQPGSSKADVDNATKMLGNLNNDVESIVQENLNKRPQSANSLPLWQLLLRISTPSIDHQGNVLAAMKSPVAAIRETTAYNAYGFNRLCPDLKEALIETLDKTNLPLAIAAFFFADYWNGKDTWKSLFDAPKKYFR
jgi:hypothetical protein